MKIGLIDVDGHNFPNLALMKLSAYHKAKGDEVDWYSIFDDHYDIVYMAKVFTHTEDYNQVIPNADKIIKGGTGYDVHSRLPEEAEKIVPDYSLYPFIDDKTAYGFLTRGCPNKCRWCVVPKKEGAIRPYMDVDEIAIESRRKLVLMDNNILAAGDYCIQQLQKIIERGYRVDFNQALDARLVTDEIAQLLAKVKWLDNNRIRFGCDTHGQIAECERAMNMINRYGFTGQYFLYTMLTSDFRECYERITYWWHRTQETRASHQGRYVYPHAQPYRDPNNPHHIIPQWQKDMAGWVNKKAHFVAHSFEEFEPRKGFRCREYLTTYGVSSE